MKAIVTKLFVILLIAALYNCSSDDSNENQINSASAVSTTVVGSNWIISSYIDSGQNETSDYNGYVFQFKNNGMVTATKGETVIQGNWSVGSSDDDSQNDIHFNLTFNVSADNDFDDLIDDWHIDSYTNSLINLSDESGGNGDTDLLTFKKV